MLHDAGDAAWEMEPAGGVGGVGTLHPLLPGENVPWPPGAVSVPAAAVVGCLYLTAGAAAAMSAAGGTDSAAAAWMLMSAELCHAAAVAAGQWMVGSTSAFVVTVAGLM